MRILPGKGPNGQNQPSHRGSKSRYRGVDWHKASGRWRARAMLNRKSYFVGYFDDEDVAGARVEEVRLGLMPYAVRGR